MTKYSIPEEYFYRIHHVRPRFKADIENVLFYISEEISKIGTCSESDFANQLNAAIYLFPGNSTATRKTINNWRTEISSLFGFIQTENGLSKPGLRAIELSENQDLVESFKVFLFNFQYPGAHVKNHEVFKLIEAGVNFKPAKYILSLLDFAEKKYNKRQYLTKGEVTHCIFNDLRVTRDIEDLSITWDRIIKHREYEYEYDMTGDVIRYAGDIIDYMVIADLLVSHDSKYFYLNRLEEASIIKYINSRDWFGGYDRMIARKHPDMAAINSQKVEWFKYVNRDMSTTTFHTDILAFISKDQKEYEDLKSASLELLQKKLESSGEIATKEIGDIGESLVHGHECERVKLGGREDLIHLIKRIPTIFAVGYDIQSVELDTRKRYIEVKTTISSKPLSFNRIKLTPNEWNTASTLGERYFIYRLMITKSEKKLLVIQDPVGLYKRDLIEMVPTNGAEIRFNTNMVGNFEELLSWAN